MGEAVGAAHSGQRVDACENILPHLAVLKSVQGIEITGVQSTTCLLGWVITLGATDGRLADGTQVITHIDVKLGISTHVLGWVVALVLA